MNIYLRNFFARGHLKQLVGITCLLLLNFYFYSCKNTTNSSTHAPEGMQAIDLSKYGKSFLIFVPDTMLVKLFIEEKANGSLEIKSGKLFAISISESNQDVSLKKEDIKMDEVNKLKEIIIETPDALVWGSEITQPEFHFLINKKINNSEYSFEDAYATEAQTYTKEEIMRMFESCKNIKDVKGVSP